MCVCVYWDGGGYDRARGCHAAWRREGARVGAVEGVEEDQHDAGEWFHDNELEHEQGEWEEGEGGEQGAPWVRGRLQAHAGQWQTFCTSSFVMSVVRRGYQLCWQAGPPEPCEVRNKVGCYEHFEFAHEAVGKLVKQGAVKEVDRRDIHCLLGLDVKVNAVGKKRLCLDARPVNKY